MIRIHCSSSTINSQPIKDCVGVGAGSNLRWASCKYTKSTFSNILVIGNCTQVIPVSNVLWNMLFHYALKWICFIFLEFFRPLPLCMFAQIAHMCNKISSQPRLPKKYHIIFFLIFRITCFPPCLLIIVSGNAVNKFIS